MNALQLKEALGFNLEEEVNNYKGYDIVVLNAGSYPMITLRLNDLISKEDRKVIAKAMRNNHFGSVAYYDPCGYIFRIPCQRLFGKAKEEKISKFITDFDNFLDELNSSGLHTLHNCVICRKENEEPLEEHLLNNNFVLCHHNCFEEYKGFNTREIMENEANTKNYPKSIALCILGAILGFMPLFLVTVFTGYILGILYILIPLGAFWLYKKGKAPLNKKASAIIIVTSAIVMVLGLLFMLYLILIGYNAEAEQNGEQLITFADVCISSIGTIIFCLVFGGFGIFWSYRTITKDNNEVKLKQMK